MANALANAPDVTADHYVVLGLAVCFLQEDGEVQQVRVIEPITSSSLEALLKGIPTSYELAMPRRLVRFLMGKRFRFPLFSPRMLSWGMT